MRAITERFRARLRLRIMWSLSLRGGLVGVFIALMSYMGTKIGLLYGASTSVDRLPYLCYGSCRGGYMPRFYLCMLLSFRWLGKGLDELP